MAEVLSGEVWHGHRRRVCFLGKEAGATQIKHEDQLVILAVFTPGMRINRA